MNRHTTFKFRLEPTAEQQDVLFRHAGAARFAFNQCLRIVTTALSRRKRDPDIHVPWSGFDLINSFNAWKKTEDAGRLFAVGTDGMATVVVTGLAWRDEVYQHVFEEAAVDCGRALSAWAASRSRNRKGKHVGFPRYKRKSLTAPTFRLRNKHARNGKPAIRVGEAHPRAITLPGIGVVRVHNDTRRVRRLLAKNRGRVLFATISYRASRWWIALNIDAADLHPGCRHAERAVGDRTGWVGVDRGLSAFVVAATSDGREVARVENPPRALARGLKRQRRLDKSVSRKQKGSINRKHAAARLGRHHHRIANIRRRFLHQVSNELVKTHDRLVIEDLNIAGMKRNRHLARAISDAGWAEFGRQLRYKSDWRGGEVATADRWFPSSKQCSICGSLNPNLILSDRVFACPNEHELNRDLNAAANLAQWGEANGAHNDPRTPTHGGRVTNARRRGTVGRHATRVGATVPEDAGTDVHAAPAA